MIALHLALIGAMAAVCWVGLTRHLPALWRDLTTDPTQEDPTCQ